MGHIAMVVAAVEIDDDKGIGFNLHLLGPIALYRVHPKY